MNDRAMTLLEGRRKQLGRAVGRPLTLPLAGDQTSLSESEREHLCSAARDLYLNELAWENITDEEQVEGEPLAELVNGGGGHGLAAVDTAVFVAQLSGRVQKFNRVQ